MSVTKPMPPSTWMAWCAHMVAASDAQSLAMAASLVKSLPASLSTAARQVSRRELSMAQAILESLSWMAYMLEMGAPKASRSMAYFVATSRDAWAMPSACAAMPMRPPSRVVIAILKPSPGLPSMAEPGTRTLSMIRLAVEDPRMPSLSSLAPRLNPGASVGTRKALMPLCFLALSVVANTMAAEASCALVIHALVPLSTKSEPSAVAVVDAAPASEPLPGSESPKQPTFSPAA
mmetsp:Transcript_16049/g.53941  ORF Transcript_16049/g.53941 Transcript_16049/m.53941 type:complete len:234 (+) Transcript_16049:458-1159(+)